MKIAVPAVLLCSALASTTQASFVGWTSTVRSVAGGSLINVFAVVDSSSDVLLSVYGSNAQSPNAGFVTTTSAGGFIQAAGAQGLWAPTSNQSWTTLDSFLTVGGSFNTTSGNFLGNSSSLGDPSWNVSYVNTASGETETANAFAAASNEDGFTNPYTNTIPALAGFYLGGGSSSPGTMTAAAAARVAAASFARCGR